MKITRWNASRCGSGPSLVKGLAAHHLAASLTLLCIAALGSIGRPSLVRAADPPDFVWLEGEEPASISPADYKPQIAGWGHQEYLSQQKWLQISIDDPAKVDQQVPADGIILSYKLETPKDATYEIWNRVGYEKIRSPFDWRIDNADWATITPAQDTLDVEEIQTWNPVGWLKMGTTQLSAGLHTLQIRLMKTKDDQGKTAKIMYASDALVIDSQPFQPEGILKPGGASDVDRAAADQVFQIQAGGTAVQTPVSLKGPWQIAAWDEQVVDDRTGPIKQLPPLESFTWQSIPIPSDRNSSVPEMNYVHRYLLRTRLNVPVDLAGRSFYLHFPSMSMLATVFVNGQAVGFDNTPFAVFDCDVTRALKPGQVNEVCVGIKDAFYGLADANDAKHLQYIPFDFWHYNTTNQLDFPVLSHYQTGILNEPSLVVAGQAYASDVFAIPSVKNKTLGLEITVNNPTDHPLTVRVSNIVVPLAGGTPDKTFGDKELQIPAGQDAVLKTSEPWAKPRLWWPDDPQQYVLSTGLLIDGKVIDERKTKFGFREWDWHGPTFALNGIPWHGRADLVDYNTATEDGVATWRKHGQDMQRLWGEGPISGKEIDAALNFFDAHGVPIRRTGILDGEGAAGFYNLTEDANVGGKNVRTARKDLFDNWRRQLAAWAKGQRNHPSIFIWSMENEITFINSSVFGNNPYTDPEMKKASDLLFSIDPTRPQMVDGGNALLDESLPVYGGHYMEPEISTLPEGAYDAAAMAHRQKWPITEIKPMLLGEAFYANGTELSHLATIGGEAAFVGKAESHPAIGMIQKMLSEGYRWNGISFHFWSGGETDLHYNSWQPIAVLSRRWDWTLGSGQKTTRTLGIFNDTRYDDPITFKRVLMIDGKMISSETSVHKVPAGGEEKFDVAIQAPAVTTRQEGEWILTLSVRGQQVFKDVKAVSVLPVSAVTGPQLASAGSSEMKVSDFLVYDPSGGAIAFLKREHIPFTPVQTLDPIPTSGKVLLIGANALSPAQSTSSQFAAYAASGRTVIVLEQQNPLRFQGLPGDMMPDKNQGSVAFPEDAGSPVLAGLKPKDFFTWGPDGVIYRNAYVKPSTGGKSLVQCGDGLQNCAVAQMQAGKGILLLSQLAIAEKLESNPVAQKLLLNMIAFGKEYKQVFCPVQVAAASSPLLLKTLDTVGLKYTPVEDPLEALNKPRTIAVINASPLALQRLAGNMDKVDAFLKGGGWIIFNNLGPEGLADYNKIVGFDHMIRPYKQEKVTWPLTRNPLTAGLPTSNIVMGSGKQIFGWSAGQYPDTDAFSYVLDYDEVAPFGKSNFWAWNNITNNYTMADGFWPLIINFPAPDPGKTFDIPISLPKPQTLTQFTWVSDLNYAGTTKIALKFSDTDRILLDTEPNGDPQTFAINPPRNVTDFTLQIVDWQHNPAKQSGGKDLVGIDNIYLKAARPADFYQRVKPMLNIGALLEYPRGAGGLVLCNIKLKDKEAVAENSVKKQNILAAILRNLKAPFSGGKTVIAGAADLNFTPIDISKQANQFRGDQGWFGDRLHSFADLPSGKHTFAGVPYNVYEFTTSMVPTVIMLSGNGILAPGKLSDQVTGIPVNQKADALFFLQAARIDQRRSGDDIKRGRNFEMADYIIHYADGQTMKVPIYSEVSVENYKQPAPTAIPGAQIAWTAPYGTTAVSAVSYSMQWNNPRPDVPIQSVDLVYGPDRRGVPALIALTAATVP